MYALDSLDKAAIAELRVYMKPPPMVINVMSAVCILLQVPYDWKSAKQTLLSDPLLWKRLVQLDKDAIPDKVFNKLKKITKNEDFNPERIGEVVMNCDNHADRVISFS